MNDVPAPTAPSPELDPADRQFIESAVRFLERPSFLIRLANMAGKPLEAMLGALPGAARNVVSHATTSALNAALRWAIRLLPHPASDVATLADHDQGASPGEPAEGSAPATGASAAPSDFQAASVEPQISFAAPQRGGDGLTLSPALHTALAATTGAVGGAFGVAGLAVELPATTTIMLRSIAAAAARHGADLADPATRLQCLAVLSLGAPAATDMESAYFSARLSLAMAVRESAQFLAAHGAKEVAAAMSKGAAPALLRLVAQIASRFEIVITEKIAAQATPIFGAAAGALINAAFTDHFNHVADYHFGVLRLERQYGAERVRATYEAARRQYVERRGSPAGK